MPMVSTIFVIDQNAFAIIMASLLRKKKKDVNN
jgi:hypothetical protein